MDLKIRELYGPDLSNQFLETLAGLAEVRLTVDEAMEIFRSRLRAGILTYVAELDSVIVGTLTLLVERKFIHAGGRVGHIEDVAVHPDHRKKGIGIALVKFATQEAKKLGCYKVLLNCYEHLVPFYAKIGYKRHDVGLRVDL